MGRGSNLAIQRRNLDASFVPLGFELSPDVSGADVVAENPAFHAGTDGLQPGTELRLTLAFWKTLNAPADLANSDGAHIEFALMLAEPLNDLGVRLGFDRLAVNVRIDEITHRAGGSESSRSRAGISNGTGQASRRSTKP